jgi:serine/threonine protein kinase/tetratricopeptide (TPR) repeat protein
MAATGPGEQVIFEAARKLDVGEAREAYLQLNCGGDAALGKRVRALLRAYEEGASFLEEPAASLVGATDPPISECAGTVIGPYKLMEQIGEGGMGVVFVAEQQHPVRRKVAVKLIKPGMDSREVIARFGAERQALALMAHANIASVFDAGTTESGRPYFVMELVRGTGITQFCDDNRFSPRERLGLFVDVCQAVQHAHHKGIIHRDLKAANILVTLHDGRPVVKVIDFGVAKAIGQQLSDRTVYTRYAQMIGTPAYMSPEQAELSGLDVDTRSDIYSLGVLLYELLTGVTPFDKERLKTASYDEIRRIVREEEPPRPSKRISTLVAESLTAVSARRKTEPERLSQLCRGELDWIVMKALEKDRDRRYQSASAFAADVERYLNDEPVQACPPTATYRLRKFARRYRTALGLVCTFVALVALAAAVSAWLAVRATLAERQALAERDRAQQEKDRAETSYKLARGALDEVVKLEDDPRFRRGSLEDVRRALLHAEAAFYQNFVRQRGDDPQFQSERVGAFLRLAEVTSSLASKEVAIQNAQQALVVSQDLAGQYADVPEYRADLARSHDILARLYQETGRYKEAEASSLSAVAISERLVSAHPASAHFKSQLATQHFHRCGLFQEVGRSKDAEAAGRHAVAISEQLAADHPGVARYQADLARDLLALQDVFRNSGRHNEAEATLKQGIAIGERLSGEHPEVTEYQTHLARGHHELGVVYMDLRRYDKAEASYRKSIAIVERMVRDHPSVALYQADLAANYANLGIAYMERGRSGEADECLRKALDLRKRLTRDNPTVPEYHAELANVHIVLASEYARTDRRDEAEAVLKGIAKDSLNAIGLYNLACLHALCAQSPGKNPEKQAPAADRQKRAEEHASRAMDVLRQAVAKGFGNAQLLRTDHDLDSLRSRDDFHKLLAELERNAKK